MLSLDSSPEMERLQIALWRRMSPLEKALAVDGLSRATQELALAGIRQRHPHASEREYRLRLAVLNNTTPTTGRANSTLGPRLAVRAYPEAADLLDRPSAKCRTGSGQLGDVRLADANSVAISGDAMMYHRRRGAG